MSVHRSVVALSLCVSLGAAGCTNAEDSAAEKTADATEKTADATEKTAGAKDDAGAEKTGEGSTPTSTTNKSATPTTTPSALAAAVSAMVETEASYPAPLDPLLDLLPADTKMMAVIRDIDDLLALVDATLIPMEPAIRSFAAMADKSASDDIDKVLKGYQSMSAAMRGPDFDLDKGLAIGELDDDGVVIYGTSTPDALPTMLRSLGAEGDDMPDECAAIPSAPGYAVCTSKPETLAKYAPGKSAAAFRRTFEERFGNKDVESSNILTQVQIDPGGADPLTFAIATAPGLVHTMFSVGTDSMELADVMGSGESPGLGMISSGGGFYWLKIDPEFIAKQNAEAPVPARAMLKTLTGELLLGTVADPQALVVLAGVNDPAPAAGLVTLAGMATGEIPKTLPDGSGLEVAVEPITVDGKSIQTLHAVLTPTAKGAELFARMGMVPEAWLFSAGGYAGVALGCDKSIIEKIARYEGGVVHPDVARTLPKSMAQSLVDHKVGTAMHMPIDGIQSPQVVESFEAVAKDLPAGDLPPGTTPSELMKLAQAIISPVSSMSVWMPPPDKYLTVHIAYSMLGDSRTAEGKAALEAMTKVAGGGDPASIYGELAARFPSSPRTMAYQARAGTHSDGALISTAILGVMAAIAVPAFVKYKERSMEAGMAVEAARAEAEAEAARAAAEAAEAEAKAAEKK